MTDELERHAGKPEDQRHPIQDGAEPDPADYADPRVAQPGEDPPGEQARHPADDPG